MHVRTVRLRVELPFDISIHDLGRQIILAAMVAKYIHIHGQLPPPSIFWLDQKNISDCSTMRQLGLTMKHIPRQASPTVRDYRHCLTYLT